MKKRYFEPRTALAEDLSLGDAISTEYYAYRILSRNDFCNIPFDSITILYGGNGSGKTTVLNIIAEKLNLMRTTPYNCGRFSERYLGLCSYSTENKIPEQSLVVASDGIFDYMLNLT